MTKQVFEMAESEEQVISHDHIIEYTERKHVNFHLSQCLGR